MWNTSRCFQPGGGPKKDSFCVIVKSSRRFVWSSHLYGDRDSESWNNIWFLPPPISPDNCCGTIGLHFSTRFDFSASFFMRKVKRKNAIYFFEAFLQHILHNLLSLTALWLSLKYRWICVFTDSLMGKRITNSQWSWKYPTTIISL